MSVQNFNASLELVLREEGGDRYTTTAGDHGGATKWGISQRAYPNLDIASLTREDAAKLYRRDYWNAVHGDELPAGLDHAAFDFAVNAGPREAVHALQLAVGAHADGVFGPETLSNATEADLVEALRRYAKVRQQFYLDLVRREPLQLKFRDGWLDRATGASLEALWLVAAQYVPGGRRRTKGEADAEP